LGPNADLRSREYALANAGHDTRALQDWLGHRSIQHTVRYADGTRRWSSLWTISAAPVVTLSSIRALGHSIGAIAQAIGRPKSTVWRELSRNRLPSGRYSPLHAAGAYLLRRRREALIERECNFSPRTA
jgi:hypothetical protein